jgi:acyl-CoA thioesterase-1
MIQLISLIKLGLSQLVARARTAKADICKTFTLLVLLSVLSFTTQASTKVLVLGDSLSAGYGMALDEAWPALLEQRLQQDADKADWQVINASISGETSEGGVRRLPALLNEFQPQWLLLELGANDGLRGYPVPTISANLSRMIGMAQQQGIEVVVIGIQIPPNYGARYTKPFFEQYAQLSKRFDTQLVPFILEGVAIHDDLMQADGLHPTIEAQPIVLENVMRHVQW